MISISKPLWMAILLALFVIAAIVGGPSNGAEVSLMRHLALIRPDWPLLTGIVAALTSLGGAYVTVTLAAVASLWLLLRSAPARALLLALCVIIERSAVEWLKVWIGRPRPNFPVDYISGSLAFPSGHSASSMTAFLATALIATPPKLRRTAAKCAVLLSVLVGLTRVYLGVHWPTDVIGGWAFGLLAVGTTLIVGERSVTLHFEPQHQIVGRHRPPGGEDEAA
jgi:undecaprenyl-diphosphatase